jgi:tetratricopeptide (TPR) repeat protein
MISWEALPQRIVLTFIVLCLPCAMSLAATGNELVESWQDQLELAREATTEKEWVLVNRAYASAVAHAESFPEGDPRLIQSLSGWVAAAKQQQDYTRAIELQARVVELQTMSERIPDEPRIRGLHDLANLHKQYGDPADAESLFREALLLRETVDTGRSPTVGSLLSALSSTIQTQRPEDPEAIELLQRKASLEQTSTAWIEVARYYVQREAHAEAIQSYEAAIVVERRRVVADRPRLANLLSTIARQHFLNGATAAAESAYLEALELRESHLGPLHPNLAFTLRGLAEVLVGEQRYREAEGHLLRAEELTRAAWGETAHACSCQTDDLLLEVYRALGDEEVLRAREAPEAVPAEPDPVAEQIERIDDETTALIRARRYGDAAEKILEAQALREDHYGPDSLHVVKGLETLGRLRRSQGNHDEALRLYQRSLEIIESRQETSDPWLAAVLDRLAKSYRSMGKFGEAEPYLLRELEVRERLGHNLLAARVLESLAATSRSRSAFDKAASYHGQAARLWREFAGEQAPEVRNNLTLLATDYSSLKRYDEAEALLLDLLEEEEQVEAHPDDLLKILRPLVNVYASAGQPDRAAAVQGRVDRLNRLKSEIRTAVEGEDN